MTGVARIEGDEEVMRAGQPFARDLIHHFADQPAHGGMHQVAVIDGAVSWRDPCAETPSIGVSSAE
jgi:hypothetical protein